MVAIPVRNLDSRPDPAVHPIGNRSKRELYDWKMIDKPGTFAMISKKEIMVDDRYQRPHSVTKAKKLAAEWSWVACGAISVALREAGGDVQWFAMDGQHRVLAAQYRDDIDQLPCMVFDLESVSDEAKGFLLSNTNRRNMSMVDRFKALLMTEDHHARIVNELVLSAGRTVRAGGDAHSVACVQIMLHCAREDEAALRRAWIVVKELCGTEHRITQTVVQGLWYLERHLKAGESLSSTHWRKRIVQVGYRTINEAMEQSAIYHGGGRGMKNCAMGVANAINKGLRNHLEHTIRVGADE